MKYYSGMTVGPNEILNPSPHGGFTVPVVETEAYSKDKKSIWHHLWESQSPGQ